MGWPDIRFPDGTEIIPQLDLRMAFDLYAGVRPIRWFPGCPRILADERASGIDFVLVREQTEGLFYARGRADVRGDDEVYDTQQITRKGTARVSEFAFRIARAPPGPPRQGHGHLRRQGERLRLDGVLPQGVRRGRGEASGRSAPTTPTSTRWP